DRDEISNDALAGHIMQDLSLPMVAEVRVLDKKIINEPHKRGLKAEKEVVSDSKKSTIIELSHNSSHPNPRRLAEPPSVQAPLSTCRLTDSQRVRTSPKSL